MSARKSFPDSVVQLPHDGSQAPLGVAVKAADASRLDEPMRLHFDFALLESAQAELEARVAKGEGFAVMKTTPDGLTHNAARNIRGIGGLQPFLRAHRHCRQRPPKSGNRASLGRPNGLGAGATLPQVLIDHPNSPPYLVAEIPDAYNASGLGVTGDGQTIAILIDTVPQDSDVTSPSLGATPTALACALLALKCPSDLGLYAVSFTVAPHIDKSLKTIESVAQSI
jgi:kumamolisin